MLAYENECVSCGKPCLLKNCPYSEVAHAYCDECGYEADFNPVTREFNLYEHNGIWLCGDCKLEESERLKI